MSAYVEGSIRRSPIWAEGSRVVGRPHRNIPLAERLPARRQVDRKGGPRHGAASRRGSRDEGALASVPRAFIDFAAPLILFGQGVESRGFGTDLSHTEESSGPVGVAAELVDGA